MCKFLDLVMVYWCLFLDYGAFSQWRISPIWDSKKFFCTVKKSSYWGDHGAIYAIERIAFYLDESQNKRNFLYQSVTGNILSSDIAFGYHYGNFVGMAYIHFV